MKKNKIISLVCALATTLATLCSFSVAYAGENSATMTEGIVLEKVDQGADYVTLDAYAKGFTSLKTFTVSLTSDFGEMSTITVLNDVESDGWGSPSTNVVKTMTPNFALVNLSAAGESEISVADNSAVARIKITYTSEIAKSGKVSVYTKQTKLSSGSRALGTLHEWKGSSSGVVLDYVNVAPLSTTKTIVADKLEVANTYADEKVDAYSAAIESADADKTINWVLSNAEGKTFTKAAKIGDKTAITGEATIVLGLKVFGENRTNVANVVVTVD